MRTWSWYSSAMAFLGALGSAIVLYVGGQDVLAGAMVSMWARLSPSSSTSRMFYEPVRPALHQINQLYQAGRASSDRVAEILDAAQEHYGDAKDAPRHRPRAKATSNIATSPSPIVADVTALHDIDVAFP